MAALCISGAIRTSPNEALNAILNLPNFDLAGMERTKSAAIRLRATGQWKAQFYGHAKILQHDKSIPKITDLCKSTEYSHTPFEVLIPDGEERMPTGHDGSNLLLYRWLQIRRTSWRRCILRKIRYQEVIQATGPLHCLPGGGPRYKRSTSLFREHNPPKRTPKHI